MHLAIIGAGVAGLAAARRLSELRPDLTVTLFEKSRGLGGRAATRRRDGYVFDHGAQYFKTPSDGLLRLVQNELRHDGLRDIGKPVWVFDGEDVVAPGDPEQNQEPKWTYADGLNWLGKLLGAGRSVYRERRIARLEHTPEYTYQLWDADGDVVAEADAVLLTPPAPQSAEIIAASALDAALRDALVAELAHASYRRCLSFTLAYDQPVTRPFYALVNTDRRHPISWLALEHDKGAERCPPGHALLTAQMAPQWSVEHWDDAPEQAASAVAAMLGALLGERLPLPLWFDRQGWRYALPDSAADFDTLNSTNSGLYFAGDYTAGQGRVHLAIEQGWRVAERIATG
jgi:renalase